MKSFACQTVIIHKKSLFFIFVYILLYLYSHCECPERKSGTKYDFVKYDKYSNKCIIMINAYLHYIIAEFVTLCIYFLRTFNFRKTSYSEPAAWNQNSKRKVHSTWESCIITVQ